MGRQTDAQTWTKHTRDATRRTHKLTYKHAHPSYQHACTHTQMQAQTGRCKLDLHACSETVREGQKDTNTYQTSPSMHLRDSDAQQAAKFNTNKNVVLHLINNMTLFKQI